MTFITLCTVSLIINIDVVCAGLCRSYGPLNPARLRTQDIWAYWAQNEHLNYIRKSTFKRCGLSSYRVLPFGARPVELLIDGKTYDELQSGDLISAKCSV